MVRSVEKAMKMLEAFGAANPVMGLTQLASVLGVDKSEAQRFAYTLTELGYLRKDPVSKTLQLTVKTLDRAHNYLRSNPVIRGASTYLTHLNTLTEETVNLAVLDDTDVVFVQRIVSRHVFNQNVVIGSRMPAYCTALGISMLARLDEEAAMDILRRSDLKPHTANTVYKLPDLIAKLRVTAARGYALTNGEYYSDISIGAAVVDARHAPVAAVSIAVSSARSSVEEAERKLAPLVMEAARSIPA
ncbi:MAG: IclR family transcriptional regulator [Geminicoccaceae bacterium]